MRIWDNLKIALIIVLSLWAIYFIDLFLPVNFRSWGIVPRSIPGLKGIIFAPFLHGGPRHLAANSGALLVLLTIALSLGRRLAWSAVGVIAVVGGLGVWIMGTPGSVHIGASGIIFGLIGFLLCLGIFKRDWKALVAGLAVLFLYGGALFSLLIVLPGVSWSGHFFGFVAGVLAAWFNRRG